MILVLDDYPLSRQGLESVIRMYRPEEQVLQAGNVKEAVACVEKSQVDMAFCGLEIEAGKRLFVCAVAAGAGQAGESDADCVGPEKPRFQSRPGSLE